MTVTFFKIIKLYNIKISEKWSNFKVFSEFKIKIFEFIFKVSLINLKTENIKIYSVLNTLSVIFLIKTIYFNKDKIF